MAARSAQPPGDLPPGRCLLVTVGRWPVADQADPVRRATMAGSATWQARVLTDSGQRLDFNSPFELVRYLAGLLPPQQPPQPAQPALPVQLGQAVQPAQRPAAVPPDAGGGGLR